LLKAIVFFIPIDSSHYSVHKSIKVQLQKMNNLRDILYFMSKCAKFVNLYLTEYLTKRSFIVVLESDNCLNLYEGHF